MLSSLALGVPPTQYADRQVSELATERNQNRGKSDRGLLLELAWGRALLLSSLSGKAREGVFRVEGTPKTSCEALTIHFREKQASQIRVRTSFWFEEACGRAGLDLNSRPGTSQLHTAPLATLPGPPETLRNT